MVHDGLLPFDKNKNRMESTRRPCASSSLIVIASHLFRGYYLGLRNRVLQYVLTTDSSSSSSSSLSLLLVPRHIPRNIALELGRIGDGLEIMLLQWFNIRPQTVVVNSATRRAGNPCGEESSRRGSEDRCEGKGYIKYCRVCYGCCCGINKTRMMLNRVIFNH
jgi:hypothetical protein